MKNETKKIFTFLLLVALSACAGGKAEPPEDPENANLAVSDGSSIFEGDGIKLGGLSEQDFGGSGIAVNSFLWRAALDTISFLPLAQADPFGGVITTDWYRPSDAPKERYKLNVYILGRQLRSNALRVVVFRQELQADGTWLDAQVNESVSSQLEESILVRSRQLRIAERNAVQ